MKKITTLLVAAALLTPFVFSSAQSTTFSSAEQRSKDADTSLYNPVTFDTKIKNVDVKYRETRAEQKGDTLVYNATAFKVLEGSSVEDLLSKMPGVVVEGGEVQAQGEKVEKVLLDGKEFFEGDVNLAIKTLPSDIIASIEVFDRASEQAQFTGFDDGDDVKTINIVTKAEFKSGKFGEIYGGIGVDVEGDVKYKSGGSYNTFGKTQRLSILGMSNNVNQQNFSQEDLAGVMSSSSSGRRGGGSSDSFMIGSSDGITTSNALGVNFVDEWNDKVKLTSSYFFNQSNNNKETFQERSYFDTSIPDYDKDSWSEMNNMNHRINARLEYTINPNNTLVFTPKVSFQGNGSDSWSEGINYFEGIENSNIESSESLSNSDTKAYNASAELVWRHKFKKSGRTISWSTSGTLSNRAADSYTDYTNTDLTYDATTGLYTTLTELEYQKKETDRESYSLRSNIMYTEQLHRRLQLSLTHRFTMSNNDSSQYVWDTDADGNFDALANLDAESSNVLVSDYLTNSASVGLRYNDGSLNFSLTAEGQYSTLSGEQTYPFFDPTIKHNYLSFLPSAFGRYSFDRYNSLMFRYRSNTSNPSITDMQEVLNDSNQLYWSTGNEGLDQQTNHSLSLRYLRTTTAGTTFIVMLNGSMVQDFVADETFYNTSGNSIDWYGVSVDNGVQITRPTNLSSGRWTTQAMLTYGFPFDPLRSNINISLTTGYANTPSLFYTDTSSKALTYTKDISIAPKVVIGSNISDKCDFTLTYSTGYNLALNDGENTTDNNYMTHTATAKLGYEFWQGIVFNSYLSYVGYTGIDMDDPHYYMLSASLGKKILNRKAEIKLEASDILQENRAFRRTVASNYIQDQTSNVLLPYFMVTFKYTFR
ncbi:MAG: outer membrane beta-barrel protein [Rikenellaceae bacterium]